MTADQGPPATGAEQLAATAGPILQAGFDDLYSAVYEILDDAKTCATYAKRG